MANVWRQQKHRAFLEFNAIAFAAIHDVQERVAFELPEVFFEWIIVKIGALIGPADDGDDEIGVLPQLLVAHGRLKQVRVVGQPLRKVNRSIHVGSRIEVRVGAIFTVCMKNLAKKFTIYTPSQ